jgi:multiple antibiotic resistance protein
MIALGSNETGRPLVVTGVVLATLVIAALIYACYRFADRIEGALGQTGSDALSRFFSFILICLGIQIFWNGFAELWAALPAR